MPFTWAHSPCMKAWHTASVAGRIAATLLCHAAQGQITLHWQKRGVVMFSNTQDSALQRLKLSPLNQ